MFFSRISQPAMLRRTFGKSLPKYPRTPGFRMRRRYFGIQIMWYSVRYAPCPDSRISIYPFYHSISAAYIHPRASPWNSALRVIRIHQRWTVIPLYGPPGCDHRSRFVIRYVWLLISLPCLPIFSPFACKNLSMRSACFCNLSISFSLVEIPDPPSPPPALPSIA